MARTKLLMQVLSGFIGDTGRTMASRGTKTANWGLFRAFSAVEKVVPEFQTDSAAASGTGCRTQTA